MKTDTLPDKLSDLLELALDDLETTEKDPRYMIDMGEWHTPTNGKCMVCLAGAVMAQTIGVPLSYPIPVTNNPKFLALNQVRTGHVGFALDLLETTSFPGYDPGWFQPIGSYRANPFGFKQTLRDLVLELREKGL